MTVTVLPVGLLREYAGASVTLAIPCRGTTIEEVLQQLRIPSDLVAFALVNGLQQPKSHSLTAGDTLKLVPLMGGG